MNGQADAAEVVGEQPHPEQDDARRRRQHSHDQTTAHLTPLLRPATESGRTRAPRDVSATLTDAGHTMLTAGAPRPLTPARLRCPPEMPGACAPDIAGRPPGRWDTRSAGVSPHGEGGWPMYEVSCRDLGLTDCEFDLMAYSLERLELDILAHARHCHPGACAGVDGLPALPSAWRCASGSSPPLTRSPPRRPRSDRGVLRTGRARRAPPPRPPPSPPPGSRAAATAATWAGTSSSARAEPW